MEAILGDRANVNPPLLFNAQNATKRAERDSDSASTSIVTRLQRDDSAIDDDGGDPFLTGEKGRAKKKRRIHRDPTEGIANMLEVFKEKWETEREMDALTHETEKLSHEEEKETREQMLNIMMKSQQTMSDVVDVLRVLAQKI